MEGGSIRFLPSTFRGPLETVSNRDSTADLKYAAFISYSRAVDGKLAPALQGALHRFAKPWYRLRALRVFRDDASLAANPNLWKSIAQALDDSEFFILLASPEAAESKWVEEELSYWITNHPLTKVLIALTGGKGWDAKEFSWVTTALLPPSLRGKLEDEPRYVDLRWARHEENLSLADGRFRDNIADLAAALHHRSKDDLVGQDVVLHRRTLRIVRVTIALLAVLALAATSAAVFAVRQQRIAIEQRDIAISRQLAAQAELRGETDIQGALLQSVAALRTMDTAEARASLIHQLQRSSQIDRFLAGPGKPARSALLGPDGRYLATVDANRLNLRDVRGSGMAPIALEGHSELSSPFFGPDGRLVAAAEGHKTNGGTVAIWDVLTQTRIATLSDGIGIGDPSFSPDGLLIATSGVDTTTRTYPTGQTILWDAITHQQLGTLYSESPMGRSVFSPNGTLLAVEEGAEISVWNVALRRLVGRLSGGHSRGIFDIAFSPNGRFLATGGHDAQLVLWEVASLSAIAAWARTGDVGAVAFSPDSRTLAAGDDSSEIGRWDVETRTQMRSFEGGHTSAVLDISFNPVDGKLISSGNDGRIISWNTQEIDPLVARVLPHIYADTEGRHAAFSHDGSVIAATAGADVVLWNVEQGISSGTLSGAGSQPVFSPDGRRLATVSAAGVALWDIGRQIREFELPGYATGLPTFSPSGQVLATTSVDGVTLWDIDAQERVAVLEAEDVRGIAFSPDGRLIATGGSGFTDIALWDAATGAQLSRFSSRSGDPVFSLTFSPDGNQLAWSALESANTAISGDYTIMIWDLTTESLISSYTMHNALPRTVAFSADGEFLAWDGENIQLWSVDSRSPVTLLRDPDGQDSAFLYNPVFSPDGRFLAADRSNGGIVVWNVGIEQLVERACSIAGRERLSTELSDELIGSDQSAICV